MDNRENFYQTITSLVAWSMIKTSMHFSRRIVRVPGIAVLCLALIQNVADCSPSNNIRSLLSANPNKIRIAYLVSKRSSRSRATTLNNRMSRSIQSLVCSLYTRLWQLQYTILILKSWFYHWRKIRSKICVFRQWVCLVHQVHNSLCIEK